jgi:hypothetical protein
MPCRMQALRDCSDLTGHDHLEAANRAGPGAVNGQVFVALTHFPDTCCSRWFWVPAGAEAEVRPSPAPRRRRAASWTATAGLGRPSPCPADV